MSSHYKEGDRVIILDGRKDPGPIGYWSITMTTLVGRVGTVLEITLHDKMAYVRVEGNEPEERRTWWYYFKWLGPDQVPFDVDTFAIFLRSPVGEE